MSARCDDDDAHESENPFVMYSVACLKVVTKKMACAKTKSKFTFRSEEVQRQKRITQM